jgi:ribosomal protein L13
MGKKLKVYAGPKHPHDAQQPQQLEIPGAVRGTGT